MILLPVMLRQHKVVNINASTSNINLFTQAGSPTQPISIYCNINANITSTSYASYAFMTGTGWKPGTYILINNKATISGFANTISGSAGAGGAGGKGGSYPTNAVAGSSGGTGGIGGTGGPSFAANTATGVRIALNNLGSITGGLGGPGGSGGGGGGGGGGYGRTY